MRKAFISIIIDILILVFAAMIFIVYIFKDQKPDLAPIDIAQSEPTQSPAPTLFVRPTPTPSAEPTATAPSIELAALQEQYGNEDIVGYLKINDTTIDYPVVQSDDNKYYLDHDIYRESSVAGWIFMDYENDIALEDKNIVIYGHNMKQDTMFHSLRYYLSEDYFQQHRHIRFQTAYGDYTWEVFSFYRTDISFPYIQVLFPTPEAFYSLALQMKSKSLYETGVTIHPEDRILTLSTCTNESEDTRFVLNAKLITTED